VSRLPVEQLPARLQPVDLSGTEVHHLPDWRGYEDPKRLEIIKNIAKMRGRDPRIRNIAVDIIKKARVAPRDYQGQAAALLRWVQDPRNVYYVNEPGEYLQDPIYTLKVGYGDCDDQSLLLCAFFEAVRLPWRLVIGGLCPDGTKGGKKTRFIEGTQFPQGCKWAHIYCMVGDHPFHPKNWFFAETTIPKVPLGWDVVSGSKSYLPEMEAPRKGPARIAKVRGAPFGFRPSPLPTQERRSSAYGVAYGQFESSPISQQNSYGQVSTLSPMAVAIGAGVAVEAENEASKDSEDKKLLKWESIIPSVVTGAAVVILSQVILSYLKPKLNLK
jgi:hypothetical protein